MKQYIELLNNIVEKGTEKPAARENMPGTKSYFGYQFRHNLSTGFPLLTTKKMSFKVLVFELLWFLRGDTNIKFLVDNGVNIWNQDAYNYYVKIHKSITSKLPIDDPFFLLCKNPVPFEDFISYIKENKKEDLKTFEKYTDYSYGDCGYQYGKVWRDLEKVEFDSEGDIEKIVHIDQIANLINTMRKDPAGRRHLVSAIIPTHDTELALYWCHAMFQFNCRPLTVDEKRSWIYDHNEDYDMTTCPQYYLDCQLYQRSADTILGVPYNMASYSLLTHIIAELCNMVPGEFIHTFGDAHIYDNHMDAVKEQLSRDYNKYALPKVEIVKDENWEAFSATLDGSKLQYSNFKLHNYQSYPKIEAELSTGMKK